VCVTGHWPLEAGPVLSTGVWGHRRRPGDERRTVSCNDSYPCPYQ